MKSKRHTPEEIIRKLREADAQLGSATSQAGAETIVLVLKLSRYPFLAIGPVMIRALVGTRRCWSRRPCARRIPSHKCSLPSRKRSSRSCLLEIARVSANTSA